MLSVCGDERPGRWISPQGRRRAWRCRQGRIRLPRARIVTRSSEARYAPNLGREFDAGGDTSLRPRRNRGRKAVDSPPRRTSWDVQSHLRCQILRGVGADAHARDVGPIRPFTLQEMTEALFLQAWACVGCAARRVRRRCSPDPEISR
jgi:hypothetical protein